MGSETVERGFILQASYRIRGGVPVVHLYGVLESGGTFLVRDSRQTPHFHIRAADAANAEALGARTASGEGRRTFRGEEVVRVDVRIPQDAPPLRDRLHAAGIGTFEADVRFAVRYLIDRDIRGGCEIRGPAVAGGCLTRIFDDPELTPADVTPKPSVLSFDIETDPTAKRLYAIAMYGAGLDEVWIVDAAGRSMPENAIGVASERAAIDAFCARVLEVDPDILTGWNVIDFDLGVLARIAARVRHPFEFGRDAGRLRLRAAEGYFGSGQASVPGRLVLDGMDLVRGAFLRYDDYSLDSVASEVLGEGKVTLAGGLPEDDEASRKEAMSNRAGDIEARYREDLPTFARYARTDARLAFDIVAKLDLVNLAIARSRLTGMTPDRVSASIASFDFLYLSALHKKGIVAPSVHSVDGAASARAQAGGHVLEPITGLHENVWVFDFKSLYPSVIRTFNIDPLGYVAGPTEDEDVIRLAGDASFRRGKAILPTMLDGLFPQREAAKAAGDAVASQAIKILMNSFYGVLGTSGCRFHNVAIANAITGTGRRFLLWSQAWFEERGFEVLYGDTDSVFVRSGLDTVAARELGPKLAAELNESLAKHVRAEWDVGSRLTMEFEKLYVKLFLPTMRGGSSGARKRYAGLVDEKAEVEFVGMEVVRRDWTELAKDVQRGLFARLFAEQPVDAYLAETAARLRRGELDHALTYRKGLRKRVTEYTANTPPHVVAARKSKESARVVAYIITTAGPEPLDALEHEPDREHYLQKQLRPVAEPVLAALGLDFERTVGDDRQMVLF
ncbi:MAG: DNA polymerase II [Gammaproteobacteria bacterium]|nr:DNA polymerase II [Gammaproteobacteria bacterium]